MPLDVVHGSPGPGRVSRWGAWLVTMLLAAAATTCFTGDGLVAAPCASDEDCNAPFDVNGQTLKCQYNVCGYMARCGDGIIDAALEVCDDGAGNVESDHGSQAGQCSASQCRYLPYCGDAVVDAPREECDDGNRDDSDACASTCRSPGCGDGLVQAGKEQCDDANDDNTDACLNDCNQARCGDDLVQADNEECDDGNLENDDGCSATCVHERCGDGIKQGDESCDDANNADGDGCSARCGFEACGDAVVQGQEECDDANQKNTDECVSCRQAVCGDGVTWQGQEECDDGNPTQTDACLASCTLATCGDGLLRDGVETCDDGNSDDSDACVQGCIDAMCGDGFVWAGQEQCDDANADDTDDCLGTCVTNKCGDGSVHVGVEGCDDANADNNDGCADDCMMGAVSIGSGPRSQHLCAVRDGGVRCWGSNFQGQLGYENASDLGDEPGELPASDVKAGGLVTKVVTSRSFTCVLQTTKQVRCWGANFFAELGTGTSTEDVGDDPGEMPAPAAIIGDDVVDIDAGYEHACVLLVSGAVRCWGGSNFFSKIGHPGKFPGQSPASLGDVEVGGLVAQIATGENHTCALLVGGKVRCWGANNVGQLGYPGVDAVGDDETPASMPPVNLGGVAVQLDAGEGHTCALLDDASLRCWGANSWGQLGIAAFGNVGDDEPPAVAGVVKMLQPGDKVVTVAVGGEHTCALLEAGSVRCWGRGDRGQLGYGAKDAIGYNDATPPLVDVGGKVLELSLNADSTCARLDGGAVRCWGSNFQGQLGVNHKISIGDDPGEMPPEGALLYPNP